MEEWHVSIYPHRKKKVCQDRELLCVYVKKITFGRTETLGVTISIKRPDSWDDYCVSNALTLFRGTKISMRINF